MRDGVSGLLVDSRDPVSYARAVRGLIAQPAALARLSLGARRHASRFGWAATVDRLMQIYSAAMSETAQAVDA